MKKTILNRNLTDNKTQPLFLGEDLSIQRYDDPKYPVFLDLFEKQCQLFWTPWEFSLSQDKTDFRNMSQNEKFIFTANLQYQTLLDSVISRGVPVLMDHVTNTELETCMSVWAFMENMHSLSYSTVIQAVYPSSNDMFDGILKDSEIMKRAEIAALQYDNLKFGNRDKREQIYLTLISVNILEAVRFYVSFVCSFAFAENKKMLGNAKIISRIRGDEACVDSETEVLTTRGWVKFPLLKEGERVAQYSKEGVVSFVDAEVIRKPYIGKMISLNNKGNHINQCLTPDHRMIFREAKLVAQSESLPLVEIKAEEYTTTNNKLFIVAGIKDGENTKLTDYERFLIALQADGSILNLESRNGKISGCKAVLFTLKKERKLTRLRSLLVSLGFEYTESKIDSRGRRKFYIKVPKENIVTKHFSDWITDLSKLDYKWCQEFIDELVQWDGHIDRHDNFYYSSKERENVEIAQTIACFSNYKTHTSIETDNRSKNYSDIYRLFIIRERNYVWCQSVKREDEEYNGMVYCVSVPSGMFLIRREGQISVTGNCHLTITKSILDILHSKKEEGFLEVAAKLKSESIDMFLSAAKEEKEWATYLFKDGSIIGLNEQILHGYIEWLTDSRLENLGFEKVFGTKNPIGGWVNNWMQPSSVQQAPQESELDNAYKIGASMNDLSDMSFDFMRE